MRTVVPLWAALTLLRWVTAYVALQLLPRSPFAAPSLAPPVGLVDKWDGGFFLVIAADGYRLDESQPLRAAFFPGFPALIRAVAAPFSVVVDHVTAIYIAAILVTSLASLAAAFLIYAIARLEFDRVVASWAVVLLLAWPSSAFLTTLYSEGLFLVAAMGAWLLASRHRWLLAGLVCAAASFVRVNGVFLCAALVVMYLVEVSRRRTPFRFSALAALLLGLGGVAVYFAYLYLRTGDLQLWFHVQSAGWGRQTVGPWTSLVNTWNLFRGSERGPDDKWQFASDAILLLMCLAMAAVMVRRRAWASLTLTLLTLASLVTSTYYLSVSRTTLTLFPVMIVAASLLVRWRAWARGLVVGASLVWMCCDMGAFALQWWAG